MAANRIMQAQMTRADVTMEYMRVLELPATPADLALLKDIIGRHVAQFAFSSVGPMLGDDLPLDIESLYRRIIVKRRGGYCFEQNGLLYAVLGDLGFNVSLYLARVIYNEDIHPGLTHRITLVEADGKRYVADVGFGPLGPRGPVCMSGEESRENFRVFRVAEPRPGEFHMQTIKNGEPYSLYRFELARYGQADCEVGHFYSHRHPGATFVNHLVVSRIMADEVFSLRNNEFRVITASGEQSQEITDSTQLRAVLEERFGVRVNENESRQLFHRAVSRGQGST